MSRLVPRAVIFLVAVSTLACLARVVEPTAFVNPAEPSPYVSFLTFNIYRDGGPSDSIRAWPLRRELVFDAIRSVGADVIALQEDGASQVLDILMHVTGYEWVGGVDGGETRWNNSILYRADRFSLVDRGKFWLSSTPDVAGSKDWGNDIPRTCTWVRLSERGSGRLFFVFNTHLDYQSPEVRARSTILIADRIQGRPNPDPVVLLGDFNTVDSERGVQLLLGVAPDSSPVTSLVMRDSYRELYPPAPEEGTFHGFVGRLNGPRIDLILVDQAWSVAGAAISRFQRYGQFPSDHFGVITTLAHPVIATTDRQE